MSKQLKELVKIIQAKAGWRIEDVAESIGYSRVHLSRLFTVEDTEDVERLLKERHAEILQNETLPASTGRYTSAQDKSIWVKYVTQIEKQNEDLKKDKERLHKLIEDNQEIIKTNLTLLLGLARTLSARQIAIGDTSLQSLARLEKNKKVDSLVLASDKIIDQIHEGTYVRGSVPG